MEVVIATMEVVSCACGGIPGMDRVDSIVACGDCGASVSSADPGAAGELWNRMQDRIENLKACCKKTSNLSDYVAGDGSVLIACKKCGSRHLKTGK